MTADEIIAKHAGEPADQKARTLQFILTNNAPAVAIAVIRRILGA